MYALQQPYQQAPSPQIPQGDVLDQLGKVLDFADRLRGRESAGSPIPGQTSTASMSVGGMFQPRTQEDLARQEMMLRNPSMMQQQQSSTLSPQQMQQLQQAFATMHQAAQQQNQQLNQLWQLTGQIMNAFNAMCNYAAELERMEAIAYAANTHANAFLQERDALYEVADIQHQMLTDPVFLLHHSFQTWDRSLGNDNIAMDYISQLYLELVQRFDARNGQPPQQMQQQQQPQQQVANNDYMKAFSQAMSNGGNGNVGKALQRMHAQRLGM